MTLFEHIKQFANTHADSIEGVMVGAGGFTFMLTEADQILKVLIGASTLIFIWVKIYKHVKAK